MLICAGYQPGLSKLRNALRNEVVHPLLPGLATILADSVVPRVLLDPSVKE